MKWASLMVTILIAGAVAVFAIYTFGWRDGGDLDNERVRARLAAEQVATLCETTCTVTRLGRVADGLWQMEEVDENGKRFCAAIDLDHFRAASNGETIHGVGRMSCRK